jgi:hypothetical protein
MILKPLKVVYIHSMVGKKNVNELTKKKKKKGLTILIDRKGLPKSNAKTTLWTLLPQISIAFLHHGHKLIVIYSSILKHEIKQILEPIENRI